MSVSSVAVSSTCKHPSVNCQVCEVETGNGIGCCLELKARMQRSTFAWKTPDTYSGSSSDNEPLYS
jgi:hypothetical protein